MEKIFSLLPDSRCIWILFLIFMAGSSVRAHSYQDNQVGGVVTAASDGELLLGVSVRIKGTSQGVITDLDGRYTVNARQGQTLVFSYMGYITQEIVVTRPMIDVILKEDSKLLDEVVVVGYGTMKRSDITGSVVSVGADDIKKTVATSLDQALQGRAAGVLVTQNSGAPGGGISVSIRGINSFSGNEPLYVIDGVAISGNTDGNSSVLASINPSDIVSMEILKDASATAIYGSRASNGVVMITTRQGQSGKPQLTYEGYYGLQQLPNKLDLLNLREWAELYNIRAEMYGYGEREEFNDLTLLGKGTDWQKELFRSASMQNHQIGISGGTDHSKYALTGGYLDQDGIAYGSGFERFSARINMDNRIRKWLSTGLRASVSRTKQINTVDNASIIETAIRQLPEVPVRNPDGSWGAQGENQFGNYYSNPLEQAVTRENYSKGTQFYVNFFTDIELLKGLVARAEYGGNYYYSNSYWFTPTVDYGYFNQSSVGGRRANNGNSWSFKTYLTYDTVLGRHALSAMAGHEAQENKWEYLTGERKGFLTNSVHELDTGDSNTATNGGSKGSSAIESYFGRVNYGYDDRYLLTATLRTDGSSNFASDNRWGVFPSVALAWKIKNERFLREVDVIDNVKLRLGWGIVGNQNAGSYAYGITMASSASIWGQGFYAGNYPNSGLKWEETKSYNVGLDLNLLGNRIEFITDFYYKDTDNLLMRATLPSFVSGVIGAPWVNAGAMVNKGVELTLNTVNIDRRDFFWKTGLTFSLNRNKVTRLYTETAGISGIIGNETFTYTEVGQPVGQFYGYKVVGMFMEEEDFYLKDSKGNYQLDENGNKKFVAIPKDTRIEDTGIWVGDFQFEDVNKDGVIDEKDRVYLGNPEPKFSYGINNYFSYKNFDLNIFINGVYGNKIYNQLKASYSDPISYSNKFKDNMNFARVELIDPNGEATLSNVHVANRDAAIMRMTQLDTNTNNRMSSRFVEDGSYLRIKNIAVGYTFPKAWLSRVNIDNLRVYMNIQNAFTFTKYSGYDPEVGAYNYNVLLRGVDYARYPSQRIYTFGVNLGF
ncbi:MAG: TonB-dependent receptor [Bacteroides sp.]|nr:TonB-dependent receptor [Bacteroides sp.]